MNAFQQLCGAAAIILTIATVDRLGGQAPDVGPGRVAGIAFSIDTSVLAADARGDTATIHLWSAFASYNARITFAKGRGRLDVLWRRPSPILVIDRILPSVPVATAGEYYLFDSTGFVLVHPSTRTFSRFEIIDAAFRLEIWREGWPRGFRTLPVQINADPLSPTIVRTPTWVYWHANHDGSVIAYGRLAIRAAPIAEVNVARWFGAARAIEHVVAATGRMPSGELTVTAAIPRTPEPIAPPTYLFKQRLTKLEVVAVDTTQLSVPSGFTERKPAGQARKP
jgi:hypothetical protein